MLPIHSLKYGVYQFPELNVIFGVSGTYENIVRYLQRHYHELGHGAYSAAFVLNDDYVLLTDVSIGKLYVLDAYSLLQNVVVTHRKRENGSDLKTQYTAIVKRLDSARYESKTRDVMDEIYSVIYDIENASNYTYRNGKRNMYHMRRIVKALRGENKNFPLHWRLMQIASKFPFKLDFAPRNYMQDTSGNLFPIDIFSFDFRPHNFEDYE